MEKVTIGVVNFNGKEVLIDTLQSIQNLVYPAFEVIVVDNGSTDGSLELAQEHFPAFHYVPLESNRGPAGARNLVLQLSRTDYVFMMDNDIVLEPDVLDRLMQVMKYVPNAGSAGQRGDKGLFYWELGCFLSTTPNLEKKASFSKAEG